MKKRIFTLLIAATLTMGTIGSPVSLLPDNQGVITTEAANIKCKKVTLDSKRVTLYVDDVISLHASAQPINATDKLMWSSSNKNVATVNANGVVTAKSAGQAVVTVKTSSGKKAKCRITVRELLTEEDIKEIVKENSVSEENVNAITNALLSNDNVKQLIKESTFSEKDIVDIINKNIPVAPTPKATSSSLDNGTVTTSTENSANTNNSSSSGRSSSSSRSTTSNSKNSTSQVLTEEQVREIVMSVLKELGLIGNSSNNGNSGQAGDSSSATPGNTRTTEPSNPDEGQADGANPFDVDESTGKDIPFDSSITFPFNWRCSNQAYEESYHLGSSTRNSYNIKHGTLTVKSASMKQYPYNGSQYKYILTIKGNGNQETLSALKDSFVTSLKVEDKYGRDIVNLYVNSYLSMTSVSVSGTASAGTTTNTNNTKKPEKMTQITINEDGSFVMNICVYSDILTSITGFNSWSASCCKDDVTEIVEDFFWLNGYSITIDRNSPEYYKYIAAISNITIGNDITYTCNDASILDLTEVTKEEYDNRYNGYDRYPSSTNTTNPTDGTPKLLKAWKITPKKNGTTTITFTRGNIVRTCKVTITGMTE